MPRLVIATEDKPLKVDVGNGKNVSICQCGLSKKKPYCDDSHKQCKDEDADTLYTYDDDGNKVPVGKLKGCCGGKKEPDRDVEKEGCCGGCC